MFNLSKKNEKLDNPGINKQAPGVKGTSVGDFEIDYARIKTMPEKFLPKRKRGLNKTLIIIVVAGVLIVIVGVLIGLMYFSESFNELLFGKRGIETIGEPFDSSDGTGSLGDSTSSDDNQNGSLQEGEGEVETPSIFKKEVVDGGEVRGGISFEMIKELEYLDLKVGAVLPDKETILDENNNKFKIIGGIYSFDPGGVRLPDGGLLIKLSYNKEELGDFSADNLQVLNWQEEPEINFLGGDVNKTEEEVEVELEVLPNGKIALAILLEGEGSFSEGGEIEPVDALPNALDSDGDGLTDEEEALYGTDKDKSDSDGDGEGDRAEILAFYKVKAEKTLDSSLRIYNNEEAGYAVYYPFLWALEESGEGAAAFISGTTGESVRIIVQSNPEKLTAKDWYLKQAGQANGEQIKTGEINGLDVAWSLDQFTTYIVRAEKIYLITYSAGLREEAGFKTTFDAMAGSFHFPELLVGGYKYKNEKYGFSLELPIAWKEYDVYNYTKDWGGDLKSDSLMFRLGTEYPAECSGYERCATLVINIFDFTTWDKVRLLDNAPLLIDVNSNYVFTYYRNNAYASDLEERMGEIDGIVGTFVFE